MTVRKSILRSMLSRFALIAISATTLVANAYSMTEVECLNQANSAWERVYCQVKARAVGKNLPNLKDFRNNDEAAQKELLLSLALKAGVVLPAEIRKAAQQSARTLPVGVGYAPPVRVSASERSNMVSHSGPLRVSTRKSAASETGRMSINRRASQANVQKRSAACALRGRQINCGGIYYQLQTNRPKHALARSALSESNRLELPAFSGDMRDERAVRTYVNSAYVSYIEKMLGLGLASSTMSFTTFYYSFKDQTQRNVDFAGRFETMFEFLKNDRKTLAVSTAVPSELPQSLGQCATLSREIIVCDNQKKNWIYLRAETLVAR